MNEVWDKIFEPKEGDEVRIVRIFIKRRLERTPYLKDFIGKEGKIERITTSLLDSAGWWINTKMVRKAHPKAIEIKAYHIRMKLDGAVLWSFMREDFETIQGEK